MEHKQAVRVEVQSVDDPEAKDVKIRWLVGPRSGAPTFHMRQFHVAPGGHTPRHQHPWEHEVYVLTGRGQVLMPTGEMRTIQPGDVLYIPGGEEHQFRNPGNEELTFLCVVPAERAG